MNGAILASGSGQHCSGTSAKCAGTATGGSASAKAEMSARCIAQANAERAGGADQGAVADRRCASGRPPSPAARRSPCGSTSRPCGRPCRRPAGRPRARRTPRRAGGPRPSAWAPRWTWPSTVARASAPVAWLSRCASHSPMPCIAARSRPPRRNRPPLPPPRPAPSCGRPRAGAAMCCDHMLEPPAHLGDQHDVGAAGDAGGDGDVAGVAAHHLQHHDPLVAGAGRLQAVERLGGDGDGRRVADRRARYWRRRCRWSWECR